MRKRISVKKLMMLVCVVLIAEFIGSLFLGKYPLSIEKMLAGDEQSLRVFFTLRLPRTCMAILGGFGLGVSGMIYQTVFHNPLASPDIIGVSSGASAGAAFAILFLPQASLYTTVSAFIGSLLAVVAALGLASLAPGKNHASIVLSGIAVHSLAQTFLMILKLTADPERELASIEYWIMGSLNAMTLQKFPGAVVVCALCMAGLFLLYRQVLILSVEDEEATLLGVPVGRMRLFILMLATLVVAAIVSVTGLISFVGLLAPHSARLMTKNNRLHTLALSGLMGSVLLCLADMLARSVASSELPVSVFTSLLGAPFLLFLLLKKGAK